jgi:hypothetical protein
VEDLFLVAPRFSEVKTGEVIKWFEPFQRLLSETVKNGSQYGSLIISLKRGVNGIDL